MSDIPDWLVELAAQRDEDESEDEEEEVLLSDTSSSSPWDDPTPQVELEGEDSFVPESASDTREPSNSGVGAMSAGVIAYETEEEDDDDLVSSLRSQVDFEEEVVEAETSGKVMRRSILGLLPWQQAVLAVLFFLDVVVIGMLFLVMLGRISIP